MKFLIISHVQHKTDGEKIYGYGPYIKEMNLWLKHVDEVSILAPMDNKKIDPIDLPYIHKELNFVKVPVFNLTTGKETVKTLFKLPLLSCKIFKSMFEADHIHLRCPGNMGLLGALIQIFFPFTPKTVKYAGNWDPDSSQPWSYRLQKWILSNTFLSKNIKVLVYGEWPEQSKNIVPFFTASYREREKLEERSRKREGLLCETLDFKLQTLNLLFVGTLSPGKRPWLSVQVAEKLKNEGIQVRLDLFGEGAERENLETYIQEHQLEKYVILHGNQSAEKVKTYYRQADFLIFISKSEGWPKVVAEAMFWGCLPITSNVSCVNYMIGYGKRGQTVEPQVDDILNKIKYYLKNRDVFETSKQDAMVWSQQFTLEKFEEEIGRLLNEIS